MTPALSESQIMRVLGDPPADRFTVLNRPGRTLSDTTVVAILMAKPDAEPREFPLPVASRWTRLNKPLNYGRPGWEREPNELSRLPLPYRVARLVLWLGVAAEMIAVMIASLRLS